MRLFKPKQKTTAIKPKTPQAGGLAKPNRGQKQHKSVYFMSPAESSMLEINTSNVDKTVIIPKEVPVHIEEPIERKSSEDRNGFNPHGDSRFVPKVDIADEEPETSYLSITKDQPNIKREGTKQVELKSVDYGISVTGVHINMSKVKSLTDFGDCGELLDKDQKNTVIVKSNAMDFNPFFEKTITQDLELLKEKSAPNPGISELISQRQYTRQSNRFKTERPKRITEPIGQDSENLDKGFRETGSVSVLRDLGGTSLRQNNKVSTVLLPETEGHESFTMKRIITEEPLFSNLASQNSSKILLHKKTASDLSQRKTVSTSNLTTPEKTNPKQRSIILLIIVYILITYGAIPFGLFFSSYPYEEQNKRTVLNFGMLGLLQGIVQILLLYQLVDLPILKKIAEIEGRNKGLIDPRKFLVLSKVTVISTLLFSIGIQIGAGFVIVKAEATVNGNLILLSCLITTAIKCVFWFLFIWINNPKVSKNSEKVLVNELKEINQARKDFMADLQDTRKKIEIKSINHDAAISSQITTAEANLDTRKLFHKVYDFSKEFKRIRMQSSKTFMILVLALVQVLISIQIIKLAKKTDVAQSILSVLLLFIVGTIFGFLDLFTPPRKPVLNTMKIVSLIITSASYRFLFTALDNKSKMIGIIILKLLYKLILYIPTALFGERFIKKANTDQKRNVIMEFYNLVEERDAVYVKHPVYVFQKFSLLQEVDLFFAILSLFLPVGAEHWLGDPDAQFRIQIDEYVFYLAVILIEIVANVGLGVILIYVIKKILSKKAKKVSVNLWKEFIDVMQERKWTVIGFKGLLLFIYLFIFFNEL